MHGGLTEGYAWRQGSPANALHLGRSIELLMELAWLLYEKLGNTKGASKLPKHLRLPAELLPMPLSAAEYGQPAIFLSWFFEYAPLHQWKQWLNCFMDNAIGSGSVAEELPGPELLQFNGLLKKLVYAVERVRSVAASQ
ncbi:hypothetical protein [Niabella hibiscisoli]|uniref:hypothetical protein n=1 Tax=Niabella hibiscisoli TaxID=1825928 RepID=UPI001F0F2497|nr:hypothetical protein [Niabella hibiscisoli]MCH5718208.1 hypothetical protein [Niabella hibiscisoli]